MIKSVSKRVAAIILAAGSSSRMGQSKQMLKVNGESLLTRTIGAFLNAGVSSPVVVLGANHQAHRELLKGLDVTIVFNDGWAKGMGSSLKAGLENLNSKVNSPDVVIVSVCDQPMLSADHISKLLKKYQETGKPIVASSYSGKPGVPALFDRSCFSRLLALGDEQGAKILMLQNPDDVATVEFPGGDVDLDTIEDYEAFVDPES